MRDEITAVLAPRLALANTRQQKTREAATVLFFNYAVYPSAKVVHSYTQHGSMTDINGDLHQFWNDIRKKSRATIEAPMLPEELCNQLGEAVSHIWQQALDKANAALDGERQEAAAEVTKAKCEAVEADRERQLAEARAQTADIDLRDERGRREEAEKQAAVHVAEISGLQSALVQWQTQAEAAAKARQEAEDRFSRDLEAERAARTRDSEMLNGEISFAKLQIDAARSTERELREALRKEKENSGAEVLAYRQRANRAEESLGAVRLQLAELQGRHEGLEARLQEVQERLRQALKKRVAAIGAVAPAAAVGRKRLRR